MLVYNNCCSGKSVSVLLFVTAPYVFALAVAIQLCSQLFAFFNMYVLYAAGVISVLVFVFCSLAVVSGLLICSARLL